MDHVTPERLPNMVCNRCGVALNYYQPDRELPDGRWVHPESQVRYGDQNLGDHNPMPIPADQASVVVRYRCDFCFAADPTWRYPCKSFDVKGTHNYGSYEDWTACDKCHDVIEAGDRDKLVQRAMKGPSARKMKGSAAAVVLRHSLHGLYRDFFANRIGEAVRIT